jgi:transcriptional regulator with XRE-family HTH domain
MTSTTLELGEEEKLGQFLRRERTKKGIFLSEVSEKTCVRTYYLESIEEGDFKKLPPSLIARGFVRAYANYVGVDEDAAAQLFDYELSCQVSEEESSETLKTPLATGGVIRRIEGAFLWLIPQKRRPTVDLGDFMNQIQKFSSAERTPR